MASVGGGGFINLSASLAPDALLTTTTRGMRTSDGIASMAAR